MDQTVDTRFKEILSALHKTYLKPAGFKKTGSNFRLYLSDGLYKIINFQKSQFNSNGDCNFTMNIVLYFEKDLQNPNIQFKEYECVCRARVSDISPRYSRDQWWKLTESSSDTQLYTELEAVLSEDVLPWLEQFSSIEDAIRLKQCGALKNLLWRIHY